MFNPYTLGHLLAKKKKVCLAAAIFGPINLAINKKKKKSVDRQKTIPIIIADFIRTVVY